MLVITLGSIASGSTWTFNAARALFARTRPDALSLSAGEAGELFDNVPPGAQDIILKAHWLDPWLLRIASIFPVRVIVTTRDPRDSLVSQRERFGATLQEAVRDLTRSGATLAMMHEGTEVLRLRYEDRYMDDPQTIARIAEFLGLDLDQQEMEQIFSDLLPERVTRQVDRWQSLGILRTSGYDSASHWHENHIGDGECGKWRERLSSEDQEAVIGALGTDFSDWRLPESVHWSPKLFTYHDDRQATADETITCEGEGRALVWGPYLHLRAGRWQIVPEVELSDTSGPLTLRIDSFVPAQGREVLALRAVNLPASSPDRLTMEFDHHNHLEPLELRISTTADRRSGAIRFTGASLKWLGPSERRAVLAARRVSEV